MENAKTRQMLISSSTGERRVWKPTSVVRRRAGGEGLRQQYLACGLSYLVVLYRTREGIEQAKNRLEHWLKEMGLEMKPSKTRIAHTLEALEAEPPGFDFLGFEIRQYPVGKHHSGTLSGKRLGFKTLIRPSKEAIKRHREALRAVVLAGTGLSQGALIGHLNPKIRGWSRYYRSVAAKKTLNDCD